MSLKNENIYKFVQKYFNNMNYFKLLVIFVCSSLALIFVNNKVFAQYPIYYLQGYIDIGEDSLEVYFSVDALKDTSLNTKMYIPEQFIYAMAAQTEHSNDSIVIEIKKLKSKYTGVWNDSLRTYFGSWSQGGQEFATNFKIVDESVLTFLGRPQTPQPPYDYIEKDICIDNIKGNSVLCGTLTLPDAGKKHGLVILVSGSGAQDRNEEIAGHQPFKIIADYLTNNGIAVFRYDDRGFGKSKGDMMNATTYDFMTDAYAIVEFFKDYPGIDADNIGIAGHSEGGMIALMLAAKYPKDIAYIISLAGPAVDIFDLMLLQNEEISKASGIGDDDLIWLREMNIELFNLAIKSKNTSELRSGVVKIFDEYSKGLDENKINEYQLNQAGINRTVMQLSSEWMKYFLAFKPSKYLKKIKVPICVIIGDKDIQVKAEPNIEAYKNLYNKKKVSLFETHNIQNLNHLFQYCEQGTVEEYYMIKESFNPLVLEIMLDFIKRTSENHKNNSEKK